MEIQFFGSNCLSFSAQGTRVLVDDTLTAMGGKSPAKAGDVALFTGPHPETVKDAKITIYYPGEYEVGAASITGIPARSHLDEAKQHSSTIYKLILGDVRVAVLGHIYPTLNDADLERIGVVDILTVPVGGNGFTLDPTGALGLIKKIEPKIVIPTHYNDPTLTYAVPAKDLDEALRELAMEPSERTSKLRVKTVDFSDVTQLIVVERS